MLNIFRALALLLVTATTGHAQDLVGHDRVHKLAPHQNLHQVARHYGLALEHISFANALPIQLEGPTGRTLHIPTRHILPKSHPETGLLVNLPERGAYLFNHGHYAGFFPLAIGKRGRFQTPTGHFKIINKTKNPTWLPPEWAGEEKPVQAGPNNPLGDRWIGLSSPGLGLHATNDPESVGSSESHGCMRMEPGQVHKLFEQVKVGWPVWIVYDPIKVTSHNGTLFAQAFPDVYRQNRTRHRAEQLINRLHKQADPKKLNALLKCPTGRVTRL